jgi:septal ring factor EnvC (AmiA/AmiB activator)
MIHGEDLQLCSHKVSNLKTLTKDKEKDRISLNAATARLSTTRRSIKESRDEYKKLQNNVEFIREEIDKVKSNMKALNEKPDEHLAIVANAAKRKDLKLSIEKQQLKNDISELHLSHIIASAGLSGEESNALSTTIGDFVTEKNKETETLTLKIAKMKHNYLSMLMDRGVSAGDVKSIEVEKNK